MLFILMGLAMAMLWSGHPSPSGRWLRRLLVEAPAAWLSRRNAWRLGAVLVAFAVIAALIVFEADGEALRIVGSSVAEGAGWFAAFDIGIYIEAYAILLLAGGARYVRAAMQSLQSLTHAALRIVRRAGANGHRRVPKRARSAGARRPSKGNSEPEAWPGLALAA